MKKVKSKRKIKWGRVLLLIIFSMFIVGGIVMYYNCDDKDNITKKDEDYSNEQDDKDNDNEVNIELPSAPQNNGEYKLLVDGEYLTSNGYTLKIENGIAYVDNNLIVNKTYSLPSDYISDNLYKPIKSDRCYDCLDKEVMWAFKLMKSDAASVGLNIYISSGYRSYSYQNTIYNNYVRNDGSKLADTYSARPGHSEHQTSLCFDLNTINDSFANTDEGRWVNDNAYLYGFIIRYPKGKEDITGYQYESWHLRYVGIDLATKLYNNGKWLTLEEYYGISSSY